jgi:hypothetical protein
MTRIVSFQEQWRLRNKQKAQLIEDAGLRTDVILQIAVWLKLFKAEHDRPHASIEELVEWTDKLGPDDLPAKVLTKSEIRKALNQDFDRLLEIWKSLKEGKYV